jgi:hypothetical protein
MTVMALVALAAACTAPNPAWRPHQGRADAGTLEEGSDASVALPDLPAPRDLTPPRPADASVSADVTTPPDAATVAIVLDAAPAPDLAPDLAAFAAPDPPLSGLVAYWRLDRGGGTTVPDDTGKNTGTLLSGAAWTDQGFDTTRFTNGGAVQLDGVNDGVRLGVATLPALEQVKTISFWFWMSAPPTAQRKTLIVLSNTARQRSIQIGIETGRLAVWDWNRAIGSGDLYAPGPAAPGWQHVAYTLSAQGQTLYLYGTRAATGGAGNRAGPITDAFLGTYDPATDTKEHFAGRIDDVRIYDRALSATEIAELAAGRP